MNIRLFLVTTVLLVVGVEAVATHLDANEPVSVSATQQR